MHFCFKSWAKETWSDFRLWFDFEIQIWITFQIWEKNPSCSLSKTKKNRNLTELPNLMRLSQFGSISHKFTVGRGYFLCPSSHIVNIFIMVRGAGTCQVAKGEGRASSRSQTRDSSGSLGSTGSTSGHRVSSIPTWVTFPLLQLQDELPAVWLYRLYGQRKEFQKEAYSTVYNSF